MSSTNIDPIEEVAILAALDAGARIRDGLRLSRDRLKVRKKGEIDLVTEVDLACEAAIVERISAAFPGHAILAEEGGAGGGAEGDYVWVIDPIDGTTNFYHGHPHCAVSIACALAGEPVVGVVYDPGRDEIFVARRGQGTRLNGRPARVSGEADLDGSLLVTGFPYSRRQDAEQHIPTFKAFVERSQGVRRMGAASLDLAWVACGRFEGFWEPGLKPWDVAAGVLLVECAGGRVSDYGGAKLDVFDPVRIVASNGHVHEAMLELLGRKPDQCC